MTSQAVQPAVPRWYGVLFIANVLSCAKYWGDGETQGIPTIAESLPAAPARSPSGKTPITTPAQVSSPGPEESHERLPGHRGTGPACTWWACAMVG